MNPETTALITAALNVIAIAIAAFGIMGVTAIVSHFRQYSKQLHDAYWTFPIPTAWRNKIFGALNDLDNIVELAKDVTAPDPVVPPTPVTTADVKQG